MQYPVLQWAYMILGWGLGATLAFFCVRARLYRFLPFFSAYAAWQIFGTPVTMFFYFRFGYFSDAYGNAYWLGNAASWVLVLLVILELYEKTLQAYPGMRRFFRMTVISGAALTLVTVVASLVTAPIIDLPNQWLNSWFVMIQRSVSLVRCGLLLALVVFLKWFRLPVSRLLHHLILAWLVFCALEVGINALRYEFGSGFDHVFFHAEPLIYVLTISFLVWTVWKWGAEEQPLPAFVAITDDRRQLVLDRLESITSFLRR